MSAFDSKTILKVRALEPTMPRYEQLEPYVKQIDTNRWYSNFGPLYQLLVERLSDYFSLSKEMICTVSNATMALQSVLESISFEGNRVVEVPSFTFSASPASVVAARCTPFFVDVDEEFRCVPSELPHVVMDVLPFGDAYRQPNWYADKPFVLVDAAASFDALYKIGEKQHLPENLAIVVSLHSTKLMGAGEGGLVISSNKELIQRIIRWQNFGFDAKKSSERSSQFIGTNAKMSEYACAIALASLDSWNITRSAYLELGQEATNLSSEFELLTHSAMSRGLATPNWIVLPKSEGETLNLQSKLHRVGFETRKWWGLGCAEMPAYQAYPKVNLSLTSSVASRYLGLPFHLYLPTDYWVQMRELFSEIF